jgi:hypothetical protein
MQGNVPSTSNSQTNDGSSGEWMTLQEAHVATGYSEATLRRWIRSRRIGYKRQGRSVNSKLEVFVTPDMRPGAGADRASTEGLEDVLTQEAEIFEPVEDDLDAYADDQTTRETLNWLRERVDDKDRQIQELIKELQGATYRNGYLESQVQSSQEQMKLLTDRERSTKPALARFLSWFFGR